MSETPEPKPIRPSDLFLYLIGHRGAIERIAAAPGLILVGALLVLSAGVARNYDHLDLLRRGEWFIGPFAASLVTTGFIAIWLWLGLRLGKAGRGGSQLLVFLNLVWLTAPCAWIYGIPVEQYTDLVTATKWNIAFLALVSVWRVALVVRALVVLTEASWLRVLALVLAPASLEMTVGSFYKGLSLVGIMGGVRLSPHEEILRTATSFTGSASFWTFVVSVVALFFVRGSADRPLNRTPGQKVGRGTFFVAAACLLAWAGAAIPFHPQIANRDALAALIRKDDIAGAVEFASSRTRADFPEIHYLPPDPSSHGYTYSEPTEMLDLLEALPSDAPAWLREEWTRNAIVASTSYSNDHENQYLSRVRERHPEVFEALAEHAENLERKADKGGFDDLRGFDLRWLEQWNAFADPEGEWPIQN